MRSPSRFLPLLLTILAAGCATPPRPTPAPPPPHPTPPPLPAPPVDWRDLAETKGAWRYVTDTNATSTRYEAAGIALFTIRCNKMAHRVTLSRPDAGTSVPLKVTTSYGSRTLTTDLAASDPLLDQIAFSRGRFTIEAAGLPELVLPAWAEPGRVIEDCRS